MDFFIFHILATEIMQGLEKLPSPMWVKNPQTGKELNIEPIFRLINEAFYSNSKNTDELIRHVDKAVQYIANESSPVFLHSADAISLFKNQTEAFNSLFRLRDAFKEMEEKSRNNLITSK